MNKLEKFLLTTGIVISSLIPLKSNAQNQDIKNTNEKGHAHLALSLSEFNDDVAKDNTGVLAGVQLGYSKELFNEVSGRISMSYSFANNKKRDFKAYMFDIGPQIEWHPTINGEKPIYFGGGFKYRNVNATHKETGNEESLSGLGLAINFGWEEELKGTNNYFYLETEYDQVKSEEDEKIGFFKINAGIKF